MFSLKFTAGAVLRATVDQVVSNLSQMRDNRDAAPPPNPPIVVIEIVQAGSGIKRRRTHVYNTTITSLKYLSNKRPIIYNF